MSEVMFHKVALWLITPVSGVVSWGLGLWLHLTSFEFVVVLGFTFVAVCFMAAVIEELISRHEQRRLETARRMSARRRF